MNDKMDDKVDGLHRRMDSDTMATFEPAFQPTGA
jgi:hypothetical protein